MGKREREKEREKVNRGRKLICKIKSAAFSRNKIAFQKKETVLCNYSNVKDTFREASTSFRKVTT